MRSCPASARRRFAPLLLCLLVGCGGDDSVASDGLSGDSDVDTTGASSDAATGPMSPRTPVSVTWIPM